jgi:arginine deiminase
MAPAFGAQSMVAPLGAVAVKRPREAWRSASRIQAEWKTLGYLSCPDLGRAEREHARFVSLLSAFGAEIVYLPADPATGLDSIYTHDSALFTNAGALILQTGKIARRGEAAAFQRLCAARQIPILGFVEKEATAEAGDLLWLDSRTLIVGRSFRTNDAGVHCLEQLLEPLGITVVSVDLPHSGGPSEVLHLMSLISLLDVDLAIVYRPLLPIRLVELLEARGIDLLDTPEEEYRSLGTNVLALSPRNLVMVAGNPVTRRRLETTGCRVSQFEGREICRTGAGGPTCLSRPLWRKAQLEL